MDVLRVAKSWYNSVMERFFGILKRERTDHYIYDTRAEVEAQVIDYILFYNNDRLHSYLVHHFTEIDGCRRLGGTK